MTNQEVATLTLTRTAAVQLTQELEEVLKSLHGASLYGMAPTKRLVRLHTALLCSISRANLVEEL